ncbi:MAG: SPFH domain-containing protein [Anaerolinea sp.]|nr:SPFH domain-containing protein [Anaerolinea sp.]
MARIIDVIDHVNVGTDELAYREPQQGGGDWRMGSQVIVNESQAAVFVRGGEVLDALGPGRHTLSTANLPILSGLIGLATSGRNPFTADLYFVNLKDLPQVGWGTNPPIIMETPGRGLGVVLLQSYGVIDIGIDDPIRFVKQYAVGRAQLRLNDIKDRIQTMLLGEISALLASSGAQSIPDANRLLNDLEGAMLARLNEKFAALGMRIKAFEANPFRAKEDVTLDEIRNYVTAEAYERYANERRFGIASDAARNQGAGGTLASAGLGLGLGQQMGALMGSLTQQQPQPAAQPPAAPAPANPQTKEEIQALIDSLDMQLATGKLTEAVYNRLVEKWQKRLDEMG